MSPPAYFQRCLEAFQASCLLVRIKNEKFSVPGNFSESSNISFRASYGQKQGISKFITGEGKKRKQLHFKVAYSS